MLQGEQWGVNYRGIALQKIHPSSCAVALPPPKQSRHKGGLSVSELSIGDAEDGRTAIMVAADCGQVEVRAPPKGVLARQGV